MNEIDPQPCGPPIPPPHYTTSLDDFWDTITMHVCRVKPQPLPGGRESSYSILVTSTQNRPPVLVLVSSQDFTSRAGPGAGPGAAAAGGGGGLFVFRLCTNYFYNTTFGAKSPISLHPHGINL